MRLAKRSILLTNNTFVVFKYENEFYVNIYHIEISRET